jgi:protoheme IX farnesyltransferase
VSSFKTYYELTKPGIIYGNLLAAAAGFFVAAQTHIDLLLLIEALSGIALVIGSACVVNNYIDRGIDKAMARTKRRALVRGDISAKRALIYAAVLGLLGFIILALHTNWLTVAIGLVGFIDYVALYGYAKRHTWHGTLVGTLAGSAPLVAGYTVVTDRLDGGALILFLIMTFWQMPHFYSIAMRRLSDYKAAHLPVLPAVKGLRAAKLQTVAYVVAFEVAIILLFAYGYTGYLYLLCMGFYGLGWLVLGLKGFKTTNDKKWATNMFLYSLVMLPLLFVVVPLDAWLG